MSITLTALQLDGIPIEPVLASLAIVSKSMFQTFLAEATEAITGVHIAGVNVAVTFARFAVIT